MFRPRISAGAKGEKGTTAWPTLRHSSEICMPRMRITQDLLHQSRCDISIHAKRTVFHNSTFRKNFLVTSADQDHSQNAEHNYLEEGLGTEHCISTFFLRSTLERLLKAFYPERDAVEHQAFLNQLKMPNGHKSFFTVAKGNKLQDT